MSENNALGKSIDAMTLMLLNSVHFDQLSGLLSRAKSAEDIIPLWFDASFGSRHCEL